MDIRGKCVMGALALAAATSASLAATVSTDVYYTRFRGLPAGEENVKKALVSYDTTSHVLSIISKTPIARTQFAGAAGADGIAFHPDGDLLVGGEITGRLFKVNRNTGIFTSVPVGQIDAFHVKVSPDGNTAYTAGLNDPFSQLATVPLQPFGAAGTSHAITGDESLLTDVVFVPASASPPGFPNGRVFYTRSGTVGNGSFGAIDLTTFVTTRYVSNMDYAHGIQFDPFTNTILLFGEHQIAQYDPSVNPPALVGVADFSAMFPALDLDQGSITGNGLIFAASNDGYLFAMDYTTTRNVQTSLSTASIAFLDSELDDIAPLDVPVTVCCQIGSGDFDGRDGQQSQLPGLAAPGSFDYRVADDFYLLPDRIYHIDSIVGTLLTDASPSILPKAQLEIYEDCNGVPSPAGPFRVELNATTIIQGASALGLTRYQVTFNFPDLWLKGGKSYWVSFIGKGLSDANERWFWGTAGGGIRNAIQGRPGAFKSVSGGTPNWTSFDGPPCPGCIGCTDFAFCVHGTSCKILNDQSGFTVAPNSGTLSLANGGLTYAQTADDFLIPSCVSGRICYIEAYIATNCTSARIDIFESACSSHTLSPPNIGGNLPASLTPYRTLVPDKIEQVTTNGLPVSLGGTPLTINFPNPPPGAGTIALPVYRLQFWTPGLTLGDGRDWWLSAYGFETGNTSHVAYFLYSADCRRSCPIRWQEGSIWGPRYQAGNAADPLKWVPVSSIPALGTAHDYAFLVAVDDGLAPFATGGPQPCAADVNGSGDLTPQDIFDFLNTWFSGCP